MPTLALLPTAPAATAAEVAFAAGARATLRGTVCEARGNPGAPTRSDPPMTLTLLVLAGLAHAGHPAVAQAERWLDTPYAWGGRGTRRHPGLDCLGLLYRAWGPVHGTPWSRYPVDPTPLVRSGLLGAPVPGYAGRRRAAVQTADLQPGDVLYLLAANHEIPDDPLLVETRPCAPGEAPDAGGHCTTPYWPWHTALYAGGGAVLHAAPGDRVRREPLDALAWDALYVTRPSSPDPG